MREERGEETSYTRKQVEDGGADDHDLRTLTSCCRQLTKYRCMAQDPKKVLILATYSST